MKRLLLSLLAVVLSGCLLNAGTWQAKPAVVDHHVWRDSYRLRKLQESPFMLEVVQFRDQRRPVNMAPDLNEDVRYEYDPEKLMDGISYRFPVLLDRQFRLASGNTNFRYKVEVELKELRTQINYGGFKSGRHGRYDMKMEAQVIVRRPDSTVVLDRLYPVELETVRRSRTGRSPAADLDRQRMYDMLEDGIGRIAQQVGWHMREAHKAEMDRLNNTRKAADRTQAEETYQAPWSQVW